MSLAAFGGVFFFLNKNLAVLNMTWDMGYACLHSLAVPEKPSIITVHQHKSSTPRSGMMGSTIERRCHAGKRLLERL
jgi:hypothetical protein